MQINPLTVKNSNLAELVADGLLINTIDDGSDLLADLYYQNYDGIILHAHNITPDFFQLETKLAGGLLQKFSNFRMRLFIIGDFSNVESKSLRDFIYESNKGKLVNFVATLQEIK